MASALWMWMANGIVPFEGETLLNIYPTLKDRPSSHLLNAVKCMPELPLRLSQQQVPKRSDLRAHAGHANGADGHMEGTYSLQ